jgi:hypothetical protein
VSSSTNRVISELNRYHNIYNVDPEIFQKSGSHPRALCVWRVTSSKFITENTCRKFSRRGAMTREIFGSLMYPTISCSVCRIASVVIWQLSGWRDRYHYVNGKTMMRYEQKYRLFFVLYDRSAPARRSSEFLLDFLKVVISAIFCLAPVIDR